MTETLLVDDDPINLFVLEKQFHQTGRSCRSFTNPLEALSYFQTHKEQIGLVITDNHMLELNGLNLTKTIKELNPNTTVVLLTGNAALLDEGNETHLDQILVKPIEYNQLKSVVNSVFGLTNSPR